MKSAERPGTAESEWLTCPRLGAVPPWQLVPRGRVVVVAPHPDDETLALGGFLQIAARTADAVMLLAVTDGEASHPRSTTMTRDALRARRVAERGTALERLGLSRAHVVR